MTHVLLTKEYFFFELLCAPLIGWSVEEEITNVAFARWVFECRNNKNFSFSFSFFWIHLIKIQMFVLRLIFFFWPLLHFSSADHYKGGTISWKPLNPTAIFGATVDIVITQRHSWTLSRYLCNETTINTFGIYNDTGGNPPASLACISASATCASSLYQTINASLLCTDFSTVFQISSGTHYETQTLAINSVFDVAMRGSSWAVELLTNGWSLVSHIDLTPVSGKINTSPGKCLHFRIFRVMSKLGFSYGIITNIPDVCRCNKRYTNTRGWCRLRSNHSLSLVESITHRWMWRCLFQSSKCSIKSRWLHHYMDTCSSIWRYS